MSKQETENSESSELCSDELKIVSQLTILRTFPDKSSVVDAFNTLKTLSKGNNSNKEKIGIGGGPSTLLGLLSHSDIEIQRESIRLLRSISVNEKSQEQITLDNGISILLNLIRSTNDFPLHLGATAVLWNLSVNEQNKVKIVEGGGVTLLINLIKTGDTKLQNEAVGCMRNLSMNVDNKKVLGREGTIPFLVGLLHCDEEKIQRNAALTLRNLASGNEKNSMRIEREKATELLARILAEHNLEFSNITPVQNTTSPLVKMASVGSGIISGGSPINSGDTVGIYNSVLQLKFESSLNWSELSPYITKKIGEGKYGDVYKAKYHGYTVACKIIKKEIQERDADQALEELKMMQILRHPNVVLLMGACINPLNQIVIVTEFCAKGNLKDVLPEVKSLLTRLKFGLDIAQGLAWLHAHHIIHRDLKLANLLVSIDNTIKISDFGLSLQYKEGIVCRGFKGNVKYSPPEILKARYDKNITVYPYNEKTDVYGYALMLWELITLEPVFPNIKVLQHQHQPPHQQYIQQHHRYLTPLTCSTMV
eukprot:TRINITY_DN4795_c0_g1_i5.p1 TRINITY_DN4795_c0_g1~~TRINITY_DN4795_c0_g1_i5.p1  ORF type:complete len:537 (-),score=76.51 TRINITY_DN4795_c0_g1_i5:14-1624(-)